MSFRSDLVLYTPYDKNALPNDCPLPVSLHFIKHNSQDSLRARAENQVKSPSWQKGKLFGYFTGEAKELNSVAAKNRATNLNLGYANLKSCVLTTWPHIPKSLHYMRIASYPDGLASTTCEINMTRNWCIAITITDVFSHIIPDTLQTLRIWVCT